jgi:MFS transporter, CP family, cyanate transporter
VRLVPLLAGLLLLAVNLRAALAAYPPLLSGVRESLRIGSGLAGTVQASALVMMGVASFLAPRVGSRFGWENALGASVGVLALGSLVRAVPVLPALLLGSVLVGLGIGGAGVLLAGVVKHHLAERSGSVTGGYVMTMMIGAGVTGLVAVPLAVLLGGWSWSLACWSVPAALGVALWWPLMHRGIPPGQRASRGQDGEAPAPLPWRDRFARLATVYLASSSVQFYGVLTWLAPYYVHLGWSTQRAALLQVVWTVTQIPIAPVVSALAERRRRWRFWAVLTLSVGALGILGALLMPEPPVLGGWLWAVLIAVGAATGFPLGLTVIAWRTPHGPSAGATSGMALGFGYVLAGVAPSLMGLLLDLSGGYRLPFGLLVATGVVQLVAALLIGDRPRPARADGVRAAPPAS